MKFEETWEDPFDRYLRSFVDLIGDRRTLVTFKETVKGIVASGSVICGRIASVSPILSKAKDGGQRVSRMATGESAKRSAIQAEPLSEKLRERSVEHLSGAETDEIWLIADGSDLRKPDAQEMPHLMKVRALDGKLVPGYRTLQVIGVTPERRGILYHRLFSSEEPGFISESKEVQRAIETASEATADRFPRRIWILDSGFDDVAVYRTIWERAEAFVCRVKSKVRKIAYADRDGDWKDGSVEEAATQLRPLAECETKMEVRIEGQTKKKRQTVKATISAAPLELTYDPDVRREAKASGPPKRRQERKPTETRSLWLVEIRLEKTEMAPILLLSSEPVEDAESALRVFRMYRQRWAIEDAYGFTKDCVDWEEVQLLDLQGIRTMVALAWVAAGFLYEMGVTFEWEEVRLLAKLGGFIPREGREPGRRVLAWGLRRLLEMMATQAFLDLYIEEHGSLPPKIQAIIDSYQSQSHL